MRRDYFRLDVRNVGEDGLPTVRIDFEGPVDQLRDRLTDDDGEPLAADEVDVAYRLHGPVDEDGVDGVVGVTNRVTGEFILELNAEAADVLDFIRAARSYGKHEETDTRYRIEIAIEGDEFATYDKGTFLVYDAEGGLLRQHSLIPSGVEL